MTLPKAFTTSNSQEWSTPWWLIKRLEEKHRIKYILDVAATRDNRKAPLWVEKGDNSDWLDLVVDYTKLCLPDSSGMFDLINKAKHEFSVWCNPPYGDKEKPVSEWVKQCYDYSDGVAGNVTMLLPINKFDQKWFHDLERDAYLEFVHKRISFEINGRPIKGNSQGSVLIHMGQKWVPLYGQWGYL